MKVMFDLYKIHMSIMHHEKETRTWRNMTVALHVQMNWIYKGEMNHLSNMINN